MGGGEKRRKGSGVGLARARAGMLARLERNVISCNCTWIAAISLSPVQKELKDACNATGILSLSRSKSHRHSEVEIVCCHDSGEFFPGAYERVWLRQTTEP